MSNLTTICNTFKDTEIRTVDDQGALWFVSGDIAKALGYRDSTAMVRMLDDDEKGTRLVCTLKGNQKMNVINESGMYHALIKSRKPEAKPFRKWVTGEVLPSIRKTGSYTLPSTITPKQKLSIRDAMNKKVYDNYGKKQIPTGFKTEWHDFYEAFEISAYAELPLDRFDDAMGYILGEWMPEEATLAIADDKIVVNKVNYEATRKLAVLLRERFAEADKMKKELDYLKSSIYLTLSIAKKAENMMGEFECNTSDIVRDLQITTKH